MSAPLPTHYYDFRQSTSTSISDPYGGGTATYMGGISSNVTDGVVINNTGMTQNDRSDSNKYVDITPVTFTNETYSMEIYVKIVSDLGFSMISVMTNVTGNNPLIAWIATDTNSLGFTANH